MRIGIDGRLWEATGVGRYIRSIYKYLPELDKANEYVWFLSRKEYETLDMPSPKWRKVLADVHWHTLREQIVLPWIFWREHLDLLHFPYFSFPIFYPGQFVITIHDLIFDHHKTGKWSSLPGWLYTIKKIAYHVVNWVSVFRAEKIFTLSLDAKNELIDHYRANPNKVVVIYESGTLEDTRKNFSGKEFAQIKQRQPYILYVGNVHPHKNVESLILAMKIIHQTDKKLRLILLGPDPFFLSRLEKFISQEKAENLVEIIGYVNNDKIAAWYHFAQAFVTASKMEGFGIPPLEAMSVGTPVILSDIPVFREINGNAAEFFDFRDPEKIAAKIKAVLADKDRLQEMVTLGYKQAAKYSWKKLVTETAKNYQKVLDAS